MSDDPLGLVRVGRYEISIYQSRETEHECWKWSVWYIKGGLIRAGYAKTQKEAMAAATAVAQS